MNRSIDLLEKLASVSGNAFQLNRRGYLYLTADPKKIPEIQRGAEESSGLGGGPLRIQRGLASDPAYSPNLLDQFPGAPSGADLILDQQLISRYFPYLSPKVVAALHVRRAGWFSAQQLGSYLLEKARAHGVQLVQTRVKGVELKSGRVQAVKPFAYIYIAGSVCFLLVVPSILGMVLLTASTVLLGLVFFRGSDLEELEVV